MNNFMAMIMSDLSNRRGCFIENTYAKLIIKSILQSFVALKFGIY